MDILERIDNYITEKKTFRLTIDLESDDEKKHVTKTLTPHMKKDHLDFSVMGDEIVVDSGDKNLLNKIKDDLNNNKKFRFDVEGV